jgi:hypothetical protein
MHFFSAEMQRIEYDSLMVLRFMASVSIWPVLAHPVELINLLHEEKVQYLQFAILINGYASQIAINDCSSVPTPSASNFAYGVILHLEHDFS